MELKKELVVRLQVPTVDLKRSIKNMINPRPFVVMYGRDPVIERALIPEDPACRLYLVGKTQTDSKLVQEVSTLRATMFPLKIPNLVISIESSWGIGDGFIIKRLGLKLAKDGICIIAGNDVKELLLAAERLIHSFIPFKLIVNDEYALLLGYSA